MNGVVDRFKEVMKHYKVSQNSLSKLINISQSTLNNQLTGKTSLSLEAVISLLKNFDDVSVVWLIKGTGSMFNSGTDSSGTDTRSISEMYEKLLKDRDDRIRELEMQNIRLKASLFK